jgi:hypothetical protein
MQCQMMLSNKVTCKGTLRQVFYLSEVHSPPMTPYYPLPIIKAANVFMYSILIHTGKVGRGES